MTTWVAQVASVRQFNVAKRRLVTRDATVAPVRKEEFSSFEHPRSVMEELVREISVFCMWKEIHALNIATAE
ncbi:hypothetical protein RB195_010230 [Necator americanus]|uniref:Uncharacterized protein n=1 Tax=Necator americanus TaxID=51031 RepID=A0ABR1CX02_NECAM